MSMASAAATWFARAEGRDGGVCRSVPGRTGGRAEGERERAAEAIQWRGGRSFGRFWLGLFEDQLEGQGEGLKVPKRISFKEDCSQRIRRFLRAFPARNQPPGGSSVVLGERNPS